MRGVNDRIDQAAPADEVRAAVYVKPPAPVHGGLSNGGGHLHHTAHFPRAVVQEGPCRFCPDAAEGEAHGDVP